MALDTYSGLKAAISSWLNKGTTLDAQIPDFIRLTESHLNKKLDDPEMEVSDTITLTGGTGLLPADFGSLISVQNGVYGRLEAVSSAQFADFYPISGNPRLYTIQAGNFVTAPSGSGSVTILYRRRIPALSDTSQTNWLLDTAPEAYLYGSLLQAEFYGWNDERLPLVKSAFDEAISDLQVDAAKRRWGSAPLAPRLGRT